jgi:hypothetical protein
MGRAAAAAAQQATAIKESIGSIAESMNALGEAAGQLTGVLGALAFVDFIKSSLEGAEALKAMAVQTGLSTDELQVWQAAARESGVQVDAVKTGLEAFVREVGAAAAGNKQAVDSFRALGVGVLDSSGHVRNIGDLANEAAAKLAAMTDKVKEARLAHELFKRQGQELLPVLADIGAGYDEAAKRAQAGGQVASQATLDAAEEVARALADIANQAKVLGMEFAASLKPIVDFFNDTNNAAQKVVDTLNAIIDWENKSPPLLNLFGKGGMFGPPLSTGEVLGKPEGMGPPLIMTPPPADFGTTGEQFAQAAEGTDKLAKEAEKQAKAIQSVIASLQAEIENLGMSNEMQALNNALRKAGVDIDSAAGKQISDLVAIEFQRKQELADAAERERARNAEIQHGIELARSLAPPTERYRADIEALNAALAANKISQEAANAAEADAYAALQRSDAAVQAARQTQEQFSRSIGDTANRMVDDLANAFLDSTSAADKWRSALKAILRDVMSMLEDVAKHLLGLDRPGGSLGDLLGSAIGGLFGGGASPIVGPLAGSPLVMAQGGGQLSTGQFALVGEHGPELIQANQPSTILPAHMLGGGGGGASLQININAPGADPYQLQQVVIAVRELHHSIEHRAVAAVDRERKRGGQLARTFGR